MIVATELGLLYAVMALGVYLTFRILDFPDLTVDGSFTTGAACAAMLITGGINPFLATAAGFGAGLLAGIVTGVLHTKGNINGLLAGILTQIGLYSINLRIMDGANAPLLRKVTAMSPLRDNGLSGTWVSVGVFAAFAILATFIIVWFLRTDLGLAMQATGENEVMARSFGIATDRQKILGLALSNGLVGLAGAIVAQYQGFADISMGVGLIIAGLASVIIGQALFGNRTVVIAAFAVVLGSVLYRIAIQVAMDLGLDPNDMKLMSAALVVLALVPPQTRLIARLKGLRTPPKPVGPHGTLTTQDYVDDIDDIEVAANTGRRL
ncbi:ABC transporter permease [Gephyromycinifex aptenodytis]|uniref:ABC transporter permease n=1 Tax=Gephyromycinifex aptenodytis TaxID=2716227 RepID=UPI0014467CE4|nr:ABC transporter permease [Gephyromycinifex aptenodytis]